MIEGKNRKQTEVASNESTYLPEEIIFEWASIESNSEMVSILVEGGRATGFSVLGRIFDLRKWFRQIGIAEEEYVKARVFAVGFFRIDERSQMGRSSSAHNGQRLTFLIAELIMRRAEEKGWGMREDARYNALREWVRDRTRNVGKSQGRIVHVIPYQDNLFVAFLGEASTEDRERGS